MMASVGSYILQTAFPKVVYDKSRLSNGWSNKYLQAIGVNGPVDTVAKYMQSPQLPADVWVAIDKIKSMTMELIGANDVATGNTPSPDNRSAYLAAFNAATMPISIHKTLFQQFIGDAGAIWLDMFLSHYPEDRMIAVEDEDGNAVQVPFDKKPYENLVYDCNVEVGASQNQNEITRLQNIDNALMNGHITFSQYLEQTPPGIFPNKDKLLRQAKIMEAAQQQAAEAQQAAQMGGM
jgi:hypothetical protein